MSDTTEKLNRIYEKHKDNFIGELHNILWQIMINNVREGTESAFVNNYGNGENQLGIADKNKKGFTPASVIFKQGTNHNKVEEILDDLNKEVFNLTSQEAFNISFTTFG